MTSTSTSTQRPHRWIPTQTHRPFFQAAIAAAGLVFLTSSPAFSQQATDSPPAAAPKQDKPQSNTPPQTRRESLLDLPELSDRVIQLAVEDELLRSAAVDGHLIDVDVDRWRCHVVGSVEQHPGRTNRRGSGRTDPRRRVGGR